MTPSLPQQFRAIRELAPMVKRKSGPKFHDTDPRYTEASTSDLIAIYNAAEQVRKDAQSVICNRLMANEGNPIVSGDSLITQVGVSAYDDGWTCTSFQIQKVERH